MGQAAAKVTTPELDLSDVKRRVGEEVGGGELLEPCSTTDIRRWVMAMDYPNPIHWGTRSRLTPSSVASSRRNPFPWRWISDMALNRHAWVSSRART